ISIVDEYLEHARVMYFYNKGSEDTYISSADWMTRNLDYRIEAAVKITQKNLKKEIKDLLDIQLSDNVKARVLDKNLRNEYVKNDETEIRAQIENYRNRKQKSYNTKKMRIAAIDIASNAASLLINEVHETAPGKPEFTKLNLLRIP